MHIAIDGARESRLRDNEDVIRLLTATARWTFQFQNGYTVVLRGPLTAHIRIQTPENGASYPFMDLNGFTLRCEHLQFDGECHDKMVSLDRILCMRQPDSPSIESLSEHEIEERKFDDKYHLNGLQIPVEPVNGFGIPQATMRCLEVSLASSCMLSLMLIGFCSLQKVLDR